MMTNIKQLKAELEAADAVLDAAWDKVMELEKKIAKLEGDAAVSRTHTGPLASPRARVEEDDDES